MSSIKQIETFLFWARDKKALKIDPIEAPIKTASVQTQTQTTNTTLNSKQRQYIKWKSKVNLNRS